MPHQLWTGQEFLTSPGATAYWWTLWAAAAATVLVWRLVLPVWRSVRHGLRVTSVVRESSDVVSVYLIGRRLDRLPVRAGQFLNVRFLDGAGWSRANPFSLSAAPDGRSLRITAKAVGDGSARLAHLRPGTRVLFEGPYGRLSSRARTRRRVLLAGAGVGITPLRALAEGFDYAPGEVILLQRYTGEPLFVRELQVLAAEKGLLVLDLPGPRADAGLGPGAGCGRCRRTGRPAVLDSRPRRTRRLPLRSDRLDHRRRTTRVPPPAFPEDRIHTETFGW